MPKQHFSVLFLGTIELNVDLFIYIFEENWFCTKEIQLLEHRDKEAPRCNSVFDISACDNKWALNFGFCFASISTINYLWHPTEYDI